MAHVQRIDTLSRHLTTATGVDMISVADDLADSTVQVGQFNARELYEYTVGGNIELRDRIFEFLKVSTCALVLSTNCPQRPRRTRSAFLAGITCRMTSSSQITICHLWISAS